MLTPENLVALGVFVLVNFAAASSGAFFRPGAWYAGLAKPSWTPPNLAFPVVPACRIEVQKVKGAILGSEKLRGVRWDMPVGKLADIAPTILDLLQLPKPAQMTGTSLLPPHDESWKKLA